MSKATLKIINMRDIEPETVDWLLYPFIPYGKITIIQGNPGEGKTTLALQLLAKLTVGEAISVDPEEPSEKKELPPMNVIYQTAEDGLGDTIKPRLLSAGADCSKVLVIDESEEPLSMTDVRLEQALIETQARVVVLDPIQAYLGAQVDMNRANEVRPIMKRLTLLAEKYHCAILLIGHMRKSADGKAVAGGIGSMDFPASARSVLMVGRIKDDPTLRVICHVKSSLAPEGRSVAFRLDEEKGFQWVGYYDVSADDLLTGSSRGAKLAEAKDFLKEYLSGGEAPVKEIFEEAEERGIHKKTLYQAADALKIKKRKEKGWFWSLTD